MAGGGSNASVGRNCGMYKATWFIMSDNDLWFSPPMIYPMTRSPQHFYYVRACVMTGKTVDLLSGWTETY